MPKGYTDKSQIENYLLINIDPSFEAQIDDWIEEVENYIDHYTGRNFLADTIASSRVFDGDGSRKTLIDDCIAVTKLEIGSVVPLDEVESTEFFLKPNNAQNLARKVPYTMIELKNGRFPNYPQVVAVTAKWGYSAEVPKEIQRAATILVSKIVMEGAVPNGGVRTGEVQQESIGRYSYTLRADGEGVKMEKLKQDTIQAKEVLERYIKYTF